MLVTRKVTIKFVGGPEDGKRLEADLTGNWSAVMDITKEDAGVKEQYVYHLAKIVEAPDKRPEATYCYINH